MTKTERNVENIRQQNVKDNQLFLEQLLLKNIRNDFVSSARSILRKDGSNQIRKYHYHQYSKVERTTRYGEKVKSGEISPYVPPRKRPIEEKKQEAEERSKEKERRKLEREGQRQEKAMRKEELLIEKLRRKLEIERQRQEKAMKKEELLYEKLLRQWENEQEKEEKRQARLAKRPLTNSERWSRFYSNNINGNPYQRTFQPRWTKVSQRIEEDLSRGIDSFANQ